MEIKHRVDSGSYRIDAQQVAEAIIRRLRMDDEMRAAVSSTARRPSGHTPPSGGASR